MGREERAALLGQEHLGCCGLAAALDQAGCGGGETRGWRRDIGYSLRRCGCVSLRRPRPRNASSAGRPASLLRDASILSLSPRAICFLEERKKILVWLGSTQLKRSDGKTCRPHKPSSGGRSRLFAWLMLPTRDFCSLDCSVGQCNLFLSFLLGNTGRELFSARPHKFSQNETKQKQSVMTV